MGDGFTDFSTYEKTKLGWVTNVARAVKPGAYTIRRSDRRGRRPAALRVDAPSGQQYWFEYRPRRLAHEGRIVPGGLVVRVVDDRYAIPPLATPPVLVLDPNGRGRPTLRPGERFRVPGGFTIRVGKTAGDLVSLHVSLTSRTAVLHVGAR